MKLVSLITPEFLPGLRALAYSLAAYGKLNGLEWIFIWDGEPYHLYEYLVAPFKPVTMRVEDFEKVPDFQGTKPHITKAKNKLLFWLLDDGLYTGIDLDMICKNDARELLSFNHLSAERRPGSPGFCSGLMTFRPDKNVYSSLIKEITPYMELADQDVLNAYYTEKHPEEVTFLDWKWNTSWREEYRQPNGKELVDDAIFLHYTGALKPWLYRDPRYPLSFSWWHRMYRESFGY